jgi:UDPglucose 6-dehydrogenase
MSTSVKNILIIGGGYVGKAMLQFFNRRRDIYKLGVCDLDYTMATIAQDSVDAGCKAYSDVFDAFYDEDWDCVLVCVPTPMAPSGYCDTSKVDSVVKGIDDALQKISEEYKGLVRDEPLVIIKSTVSVGTTDRLRMKYPSLRFVFSPEYCGESKYWSEYTFHTEVAATPFFIFGGDPQVTSECVDLYLPVAGPDKRYFQCSAAEAEMAKYMENCFYAMKIAFCNQMYDIAVAKDLDWNTIREAWLLDPRLSPMHTAVFKDDRGFGGKCFPKDLNALIALADEMGVPATILEAVLEYNNQIRKGHE